MSKAVQQRCRTRPNAHGRYIAVSPRPTHARSSVQHACEPRAAERGRRGCRQAVHSETLHRAPAAHLQTASKPAGSDTVTSLLSGSLAPSARIVKLEHAETKDASSSEGGEATIHSAPRATAPRRGAHMRSRAVGQERGHQTSGGSRGGTARSSDRLLCTSKHTSSDSTCATQPMHMQAAPMCGLSAFVRGARLVNTSDPACLRF